MKISSEHIENLRVNWPFIKGFCIAVAISVLLWTGIVYLFLWAVKGL